MRPRIRILAAPALVLLCLVASLPARPVDAGVLAGRASSTSSLLGGVLRSVLNAPAQLLSTVGKVTVTLLGGAPPNGDTRRGTMAQIDGSVGGTVQVGRFRVTVPAGAWSGIGTVTIDVPDPNVAQCELGITGVANSFARPVVLEIDTRDTGATDPGVVWFDPGTGKWYLLAGEGTGESASVILRHFSKYGAVGGKAGW